MGAAVVATTAARYGLEANGGASQEVAWEEPQDSIINSGSHVIVPHTLKLAVRTKKWRPRTLEEVIQFNFGYIGLSNVGNSCFLNSTTQLVFAADGFAKELIHSTFFSRERTEAAAADAVVQGNVEVAVKVLSELLQPRDTYGKYRRSRYYYGAADDDLDAYDPRKAKVCLAVLFAQMYVQLYEHFQDAVTGVVEDEDGDDSEGDGAAATSGGAYINSGYGTTTTNKSSYAHGSGGGSWSSASYPAAAIDPSYFMDALPYPFHTRTQQDASEYHKVVFDIVDTEEKKEVSAAPAAADKAEAAANPVVTSVTKWFAGTSQTTMVCDDCGTRRQHINEFLDLCIPMKKVKQMKRKVMTVAVRATETQADPWHSGAAGAQVRHTTAGPITAVTTYGPRGSSSNSSSDSSHTPESAQPRAAAAASHNPFGDTSDDSSDAGSDTNQRLRSCTSAPSQSASSESSPSRTSSERRAATAGEAAGDGPPPVPPKVETKTVEIVVREITVDLQTLLLAVTLPFFNQELLTADNQTSCTVCAKKTDTRLYTQILPNAPHFESRTPFYLTLQLNRFEYNKRLYNYAKVFEEVPLNEVLFLPVCHQPALDAAPRLVPYTIKAVIVHSGSTPHSGHYYCIVRRRHRVAAARTVAAVRAAAADAAGASDDTDREGEEASQWKAKAAAAAEAAAEKERAQAVQNQNSVREYIENYTTAFTSYYNSCVTEHQDDLPTLNDKLYHLYENFTRAHQHPQRPPPPPDGGEAATDSSAEDPPIVISADFYDQWYVCNDSNTSAAAMDRIRNIFCHHQSDRSGLHRRGEDQDGEDPYGSSYLPPYGGRSYHSMETSYLLLYEQMNSDGSLQENANVFASSPTSPSDESPNSHHNNSTSRDENTFYDDARYLFEHLPVSLQPLCKREPSLPPQPQQNTEVHTTYNATTTTVDTYADDYTYYNTPSHNYYSPDYGTHYSDNIYGDQTSYVGVTAATGTGDAIYGSTAAEGGQGSQGYPQQATHEEAEEADTGRDNDVDDDLYEGAQGPNALD
ncbi:hypothetical protein STCU_10802 [Strigomonas culicis]|uniref:USP domain-containing protein n=1 Tax=Strigomonas culicis TaxID=28005 RepID=S9TGI3_9TRYP|nr:hypothetical protein STCU_10802 [Strigomonas culicis]|eukprot:EPY17122.1 hypothetical protein STCU_10802 [Strigomonas culicis]